MTVAEIEHIEESSPILDVGCGTGAGTAAVIRAVNGPMCQT